jgi:hypothetical protein
MKRTAMFAVLLLAATGGARAGETIAPSSPRTTDAIKHRETL